MECKHCISPLKIFIGCEERFQCKKCGKPIVISQRVVKIVQLACLALAALLWYLFSLLLPPAFPFHPDPKMNDVIRHSFTVFAIPLLYCLLFYIACYVVVFRISAKAVVRVTADEVNDKNL